MPSVDLQIFKTIKDKQNQVPKAIVVQKHLESEYFHYLQIFTDGSKDPVTGRTAAAMFIPLYKYRDGKRITNDISVYTAEMVAILIALQWVEEVKPSAVVICSDSFSVLNSLISGKSDSRQDILIEILQNLYRICQLRLSAVFLWLPAHVGVEGNEDVDKIAKQALKHNVIDLDIPLGKSEMKGLIKTAIKNMCQERWDKGNKGRHLYNIQKQVGLVRNSYGNRKEDIIISRLRIGHSNLNKSLQMIGKHDSGQCNKCGLQETVEHVIINCLAYESKIIQLENNLISVGIEPLTLQNILNSSYKGYKALVSFLKATKLYKKIRAAAGQMGALSRILLLCPLPQILWKF